MNVSFDVFQVDGFAVVVIEGDCGVAGVVAGLFKGFGDAGLSGDHDVIAYGDVAGDAGLASENDVAACFGGTCHSALGDEDVVFADCGPMADLNEIVYFSASSDACGLESGAVDGRVGTDLDVIFNGDGAHLLEFNVFAGFVCNVPKTACTDHSSWLDDYIIPN